MGVDEGAGGARLLAGGNPRISKADGDGPVDAYLAAMPTWKGEIGRGLDALVVEEVPHVRKAVRWNSPFYGIENSGWFLSFHCFTKYVKITWLNGAHLQPPPPEASKQGQVRYLHIREGDSIDEEQLRDWIRQAAAIEGDRLF